jgi:hypothetical protein
MSELAPSCFHRKSMDWVSFLSNETKIPLVCNLVTLRQQKITLHFYPHWKGFEYYKKISWNTTKPGVISGVGWTDDVQISNIHVPWTFFCYKYQFGMSLLKETFPNSDSQSVRFRTPKSELELRYLSYLLPNIRDLGSPFFGNVSELIHYHLSHSVQPLPWCYVPKWDT